MQVCTQHQNRPASFKGILNITMGQTNIHQATQILQRAGSHVRFNDQATIQPFNKPVLISSGPFTQDDVERYTWCLKSPHIGSWIRKHTPSASTAATTSADDALNIPQIRVGPGLAQNPNASVNDSTRYILVIEGRSGASKAKVFIENSTDAAAATMMHEALNGYSTVFCAACDGSPQDIRPTAKFRADFEGQKPAEDANGMGTFSLVCCAKPAKPYAR